MRRRKSIPSKAGARSTVNFFVDKCFKVFTTEEIVTDIKKIQKNNKNGKENKHKTHLRDTNLNYSTVDTHCRVMHLQQAQEPI
jgi:hypothetical protein